MQKRRNPVPEPETITTATPPKPLPARAAAPAPPQRQSTREPYGCSGPIRVHRLLREASDESRSFFEALMEEWDKGPYNLTETAFILSARTLGHKHIAAEADAGKENLKHIDTAAQIFLEGKWIAGFLRNLFRAYRGNIATFSNPDDTLFVLQSEIDDFDNALEVAQNLLEDSPEVVAAELQELAKKRPDLFNPATSAAA